MISNDIVNEIAHLIRQRDVTHKDSKENKVAKASTPITEPKDEVELSKTAESYIAHSSSSPASSAVSTAEFEKEQGMKVERLKSLVQSGNYKMDPKMVETIAERITSMLM